MGEQPDSRSSSLPTRRPAVAAARALPITDPEFQAIRTWIHRVAGINLSNQKKALVVGRLAQRLRYHQLDSYGEYFYLLQSGAYPGELQIAIDLLTTNETHTSAAVRSPPERATTRSRTFDAHVPLDHVCVGGTVAP